MGDLLASALDAYGSVIRGQQEKGKEHEPTPTEFFVVTLKTLGKASEQSSEFLINTLRIMEAVIPQAAPTIVRSQFGQLSASLLEIIVQSADNAQLLRVSLVALGSLLCAQDKSEGFWANVQPLQCLNTILLMLEDSNTKLRKVAEDQIIRILRQHQLSKAKAVRTYVANFCSGVMKSCSRASYKRSLYVVLFLENALALLADDGDKPKKHFEQLLKLVDCGQAVLTAAALRCLDAYFQSPYLGASNSQIAECLNTLIARQLNTRDMESNTYRYLAMASGFVVLHGKNASLSLAILKRLCATLVEGCSGDFVQINDAVGTAFKRIVGECIDSGMVQAAMGGSSSSGASAGSFVVIVVQALEEVLQIKYKTAWLHVLGAARKLFEVLAQFSSPGDPLGSCATPLISQLAGIYQLVEAGTFTVDASTHLAIGETLGAAMRACGFASFLEIVPLRATSATPEYLAIDGSREWMLPLLHSNLKLMRCNLSDFAVIVLPMISNCREAAANPAEYQLSSSQAALVKVRVMQLLSLFPDFCHRIPADLATFLPRIMPELVDILKAEGKDAANNAQHILTGLAQIANGVHEASGGTVFKSSSTSEPSNEHLFGGGGEATDSAPRPPGQGPGDFRRIETPEYLVVSKQANSALPAILAFLERIRIGDPSFASAVRCVSAWASVSPTPLVTAISKKLMQLLLQSTNPSLVTGSGAGDAAASWMSITLAMVPHLPKPMVHILYRTIKPLLSVNESISSQKRAYSILEAVLRLHGAQLFQAEPQEGILSVVSESLMSAHVSARSMRLRCIEIIVASICYTYSTISSDGDKSNAYSALKSAADAVYGEALICHKDANQKTRDAAKAVLSLFVDHLTVHDSLLRLSAAMVGETASMRSAAVLGLCILCLKHRDSGFIADAVPELMETSCLLLPEESAELTRAVLTFLKVGCAVLPQQCLQPQLSRIMTSSCIEIGSLKAKFATRIKGIMRKLLQRVGEEALRPHVPAADVALLEYLLREGRRKVRRGQQASSKDLLDSDDDADDDEGDDDDSGDDAMDIVQATSAKRYANVRSDHRISARPKAVRLGDAVDNRLPSSLADLLEDQDSSNRASSSGATATATTASSRQGRKRGREEDEQESASVGAGQEGEGGKDGEKYQVVVENGVLVVREKEETEEEESGRRVAKKGRAAAEADVEAPDRFKSEKGGQKPRVALPGSEYKSKKSGGDVWRKGELEPHAYIPLDAKMLAGRNAREALNKFGGVVDPNGKSKRARMAAAVASAKSHVVVGNRKQREARNKNKRKGK